MTTLLGIPIDRLTTILLSITGFIIGGVLLLALCNAIFFKIGVRNIPRRRAQMVLIVFALMLSTTLLSSVLATGDVINAAVQSVAIYNYGNIDEIVEGGHGPLGLYRDGAYYSIRQHAAKEPSITAVAAALREFDLLVADQTSRQVRSRVTGLALLPGSEQGFGGMVDQATKRHRTITELKGNEIYLNVTVAQLLNAHTGDDLYLYSKRWPGQRVSLQVAGIISNDGLIGDTPSMLLRLETLQSIEKADDFINQIYIENRGGGGVNGVGLSDRVAGMVSHWIPDDVHVTQIKQQGVENSQKAQDIFSRIFALFSLFALAIGLLLIFLIFVLLAAERRAEMGMARAIGVQRRHLILMYLFEGTIYDLISSFIGLIFGVGIGALLVSFLGPVLVRFNFPLKLTFQPHSLIIAYCLGVIFTFCSVVISSWLVSRMTVVEAMRDLPEPAHGQPSLGEQGLRLLQLLKQFAQSIARRSTATLRRARRIFFEHIPDLIIGLIRSLINLGFLPLLAGYWFMQQGLESTEVIPFSLGLSLIALGTGLLIKAIIEQSVHIICRLLKKEPVRNIKKITGGIFAALVGSALVAYWALPFDILARSGLPRFQGGIEVFFVAGAMMVLGAVWMLITNAGLIMQPLLLLGSLFPRWFATMKLASAYPLHRRFRTGLSVLMFGLVVFTMTVMAIITNAMQNTYADINRQTGGYDIQATAYFKPLSGSIGDLRTSLVQHGIDPSRFSAVGVRSTTAVGIIQLSSDAPRWTLYPAQVVSGAFLQGYGLHLSARAKGFDSDNAIWQALQTHPNYALIDSSALPYNPNIATITSVYDPSSPQPTEAGAPATPPSFDPRSTFAMSGVYQGDTIFPATPLWVAGFEGQKSIKLTIIGIVDNSDSAHYGLYISQSTYSSASVGTGVDPSTPTSLTYYFKAAPGQDTRTLALALGSAFLDNGLETTVLEDAIWQVRGPRILLSNVLLGVVGLTLLLGIAALAITGTRAVIERRQQIGMLRALGCRRRTIQSAFLLESFLVGVLGSTLGVVLGIILSYNIFAANFFEVYQTGLFFSIPWQQLLTIVGVALLASFLGALLPAWQAGRVTPAEAIRYQ